MGEHVGNQITQEGLAALEAELHHLENDARREMAERLRTARAWGDLKENSEYHDAKNAQAHLETKILRLRELRRNAVVVEPGAADGRVGLGTAVTVRDLESGRETVHTLVSASESDPGGRPAEHRLPARACACRRARGGRDRVRRAARPAAARDRRARSALSPPVRRGRGCPRRGGR